MRRTGGWVLALVAVAAMAAGGWFALRPVFTRESISLIFLPIGDRGPTNDAVLRGARFALYESGGRAGPFRVDLREAPLRSSPDLRVAARPAAYVVTSEYGPDSPSVPFFAALTLEYPGAGLDFRSSPGAKQQGRAAAAWVLKSGSTRPFLLRDGESGHSALIAIAFKTAAAELGIAIERESELPRDRARLIDAMLASNPDLVFYSGEGAPYATSFEIFSALREKGFKGNLVMAEADPEVSFLVAPDRLVEGTYLVSPFSPPPPAFAEGFRAFAGYPAGVHAYYGYFAMKSALEAIERAGSKDPARIFEAARKLPYYDDRGATTIHSCALYVARGGRFEFVEILK